MPFFFQNKHEPNQQAMQDFWRWFQENEHWMIDRMNGPESGDVVWAVDAQLKPIFSYSKREIEFQLGFHKGQGEFFFFDLHDRNLHGDAEQLASCMPEALRQRWKMIIEH